MHSFKPQLMVTVTLLLALTSAAGSCLAQGKPAPEKPYAQRMLNVEPKHIRTNSMVHYDYPIVYVKAPRKGDDAVTRWADIGTPFQTEPNAPLMLLQPDGKEEVLVPVKADEAIIDPMISFDGKSVYYAKLFGAHLVESGTVLRYAGADIYKVHVPSRAIVRLTHQDYTPNRASGKNASAPLVYNTGPCPAPGGKIVFTSTRNGYRAPKNGAHVPQLFVMDDDGGNVEQIGHLNIAGALHPVILKDGRIMFSSLESQGLRSGLAWGIWTIHPDGSNWGPLLSAFRENTFHFQTQLSDESIVVEEYYIVNNFGFGGYHKFPLTTSAPTFAPASARLPFQPQGFQSHWTRFAETRDEVARLSDPSNAKSMRVGKVTHPSAAPDNHCLTVWSPGPVNRQNIHHRPAVDAGIYLIPSSPSVEEPGQMLLIKNDPNFNEQWPRALVPYKRIYGIDEPARLPILRNDGKQCKHLPEGTPFGLVGTSSLYKRESFARGVLLDGKVTAGFAGGKDPLRGLEPFYRPISGDLHNNWRIQGADAGLYENSEIHAVRILAMEPTSKQTGRRFFNYPLERLRVLGEFPVRHFQTSRDKVTVDQPLDPDGNPDTSFLARIPADIAWTFQTLDKDGMVLNMAQTWHQLRPGEIRTDCGGCHAHSQKPTRFADTRAARPDYAIWDLTQQTPLLTTKKDDQSGKQWDVNDETGVRYEKSAKDVEFYRDVRPILQRSCVACHTKNWDKPAGSLVLDDYSGIRIEFSATMLDHIPGDYFRLALDRQGKFGHKSVYGYGYGLGNGSRYIRMMQARRSLLVWKLHGRRTDGLANDDLPTEAVPGDRSTLQLKGAPVPATHANLSLADLDYTGSVMPPPEAVAGTYVAPDGSKIKVAPVTDEDRRTIVRWIDLGCPIDLSQDSKNPERRHDGGWLYDDQRPTLTLTAPQAGANVSLPRILIGMHDYGSGLDMDTFTVTADFAINGRKAGENLADQFRVKSQGMWELVLDRSIANLPRANLTVSVKDRQGNVSRIDRTFSVGSK